LPRNLRFYRRKLKSALALPWKARKDKAPIIGNIPLAGRLFRTNVDQHVERNLIIFVTARVITPAGLAFNNEEEEEEGLLPPALPEVPAYKK
jgi:type II secretory pathway component GspD/PulD (secretin)